MNDSGAAVEFRCDEVHRRAMVAISRFQDPSVGVQPAKAGQQRRMNVQHASGKALNEGGPEDAHKPGQYDQANLMFQQQIAQRAIEGRSVRKILWVEMECGYVGLPRPLQAVGFSLIADDGADFSGPVRLPGGVQKCLEVAAES